MKELMKKSHERENREMNDKIAVCLGKGGQRDMAEAFCRRTGAQLQDKPGDFLTVRFDSRRSEERRVGKECRSRWSPYH